MKTVDILNEGFKRRYLKEEIDKEQIYKKAIKVDTYYRIRISGVVSHAHRGYDAKNARTLCFGGIDKSGVFSLVTPLTQGVMNSSEVTFTSEKAAKDFATKFGLSSNEYYIGKSKGTHELVKVKTTGGDAYATVKYILYRMDNFKKSIDSAISESFKYESYKKKYLKEEIRIFNNISKDLLDGSGDRNFEPLITGDEKCSKSAINNLKFLLDQGKNASLCFGYFRRDNEPAAPIVTHVWVKDGNNIIQTHEPKDEKYREHKLHCIKEVPFTPQDFINIGHFHDKIEKAIDEIESGDLKDLSPVGIKESLEKRFEVSYYDIKDGYVHTLGEFDSLKDAIKKAKNSAVSRGGYTIYVEDTENSYETVYKVTARWRGNQCKLEQEPGGAEYVDVDTSRYNWKIKESLSEAKISPEDKHESDVIRSIYAKANSNYDKLDNSNNMQKGSTANLNALKSVLTPEELSLIKKYNIQFWKQSDDRANFDGVRVTMTADKNGNNFFIGDDRKRSWLEPAANNPNINYSDMLRKRSTRGNNTEYKDDGYPFNDYKMGRFGDDINDKFRKKRSEIYWSPERRKQEWLKYLKSKKAHQKSKDI